MEDIDSSPATTTIKVGRVGPLMVRGALQQDTALWHAEATLLEPALESRDGLRVTSAHSAIGVESLTEHLAHCLRQLEEARNDA